MHTFCSSLTKFSSTKSVQTRFVAPQKPLIDTVLVIKVIISYNSFIAIDPMKKFRVRFSFLIFMDKNFSRQQEPGLTLFGLGGGGKMPPPPRVFAKYLKNGFADLQETL